MSTPLLHKAYNSQTFKKEGEQLVDLLTQHLETTLAGTSEKVIDWQEPEDEYAFWKAYSNQSHQSAHFFSTVLQRSIHTHHPHYIGHQVSPTVPISALATLLSAQLNNGMAIYEMGAASTALERIVIEYFTQAVGYQSGDGFLTSGGTLGNLTALLAARRAYTQEDVWNQGHDKALAVMVSEEAHYCVDRAARIMGLGEKGIIKIPVDAQYQMKTELLASAFDRATQSGLEVIAIVGSAPSTSTGMYDDLEAISAFAKAKQLWFHVDAAHGGGALFSKKYKPLLKGIAQADSVIIDGHKMMATAAITTAVLFKNTAASYATFEQKAQYLWEKNDDPDWYNMAKRTFECTKSMMSLRFFAIRNAFGMAFFDDYVTTLYDAGIAFSELVEQQYDFELALSPACNIVCFRYIGDGTIPDLNKLNQYIRTTLLEEGHFYIVATQLKQGYYLRTTFMNPFTTVAHTTALLERIRATALSILKQ
ncbi:MAG: aminotransferase class I/II-fold pyridoxal phosphate-dependent enzyme [Dokdonia sp.]|jgi:L-2,4-diaminobutyrate decarboxylase